MPMQPVPQQGGYNLKGPMLCANSPNLPHCWDRERPHLQSEAHGKDCAGGNTPSRILVPNCLGLIIVKTSTVNLAWKTHLL